LTKQFECKDAIIIRYEKRSDIAPEVVLNDDAEVAVLMDEEH